jgi:lipopolysaccharide export system protein LptA
MRITAHPQILLAAALAAAVAVGAVAAQAQNGPPNALQGFSQNRDQPVKIDAATLEVRDKDKIATFGGNVHLVQGDTTMRCKTLVVFYDQDSAPGTMKAAAPATPGGQQSIKRLEARGGVIVTQKDQTATGENGVFDMKANTVTLRGSVVISQGKSVVRGDRLVVNLTTGVSMVECDNPSKCRVSALIDTSKPAQGTGPGAAPGAAPGAGPGAGQGAQPAHPRGLY